MEDPQIQSSYFASTIGNLGFNSRRYVDHHQHEVEQIAEARRRGRKSAADRFREEYFYGRCEDNKTCIWRGDRHSWSVDSYGITWVGVHGNDSICAVTKAGALDVTRVHGFLLFASKEMVDCNFRRSLISEMEDLAGPSSKPHEMRGKNINKPFSVVSVVPVTNKVHDASGDFYEESKVVMYRLEYLEKKNREEEDSSADECDFDYHDEDAFIKHSLKRERRHQRERGIRNRDFDEDNIKFLQDKVKREADIPGNGTVKQGSSDKCYEEKAIEFLEEEMKKSVKHFTLEETIKTAISAFQRLFNKKFKANEIEVCVMDPHYFVLSEEARYKDPYVKHLLANEIENYLSDDLSEPEREGSCSSAFTSDGSH